MTIAAVLARPKTSVLGAMLALLAAWLVFSAALENPPRSGLSRAGLASAYGRLPVAFEPNRGQLDHRVLFAARGEGYSLLLTRGAAVLSLATRRHPHRFSTVSIGFLGASRNALISARSRLQGHVNYAIGRDRSRWHTGIPTYATVRYSRLWPGVDADFHGDRGQLEYDFRLAPGADPRRIGLSFAGATGMREERDGALTVALPGGSVRQLVPHAYQVIGATRHPVASRYMLRGNHVGVRLGRYDHHRALVIDPALVYSTYLGGSVFDGGNAIAVDSSGAAYLTGSTDSTNLPATTGTPGGGGDAFVTKLDPAGSGVVYSTYLGGTSSDIGNGIAVDSAGAAYVGGRTQSNNFPTTAGASQTFFGGPAEDGFVAKFSSTGSLVYSTYLGGNFNDYVNGIAIDSSGAAYLTGPTQSNNFPTTPGAFQIAFHGGGVDAFVTKLNASGSARVYSTYLGGSGVDQAIGIAIDSSGAAYVTGNTSSTDFPAPAGAFQTTLGGGADAFVTKLNPAGSGVAYSTYLGGAGGDSGSGIAADSSGAVYVTGNTSSTSFPTTAGALQTTFGGVVDAFVTKLNASGSALSYSTYLGGSGNDAGNRIGVDSSGAAYLAGGTSSTDFPVTAGALQTTNGGGLDAFATKLDLAGSGLLYSTYLGGSGNDTSVGIAADSSGALYVTGNTASTNFPATAGAFQPTLAGGADAFVSKLSPPPIVATQPASDVGQTAVTLNGAVNPNGNATTYSFQFGTTSDYGSQTTSQAAGSDDSSHAASASLTGLVPQTTYHFRIVGTNSGDTSFGADQTFTTAAATTTTTTTTTTPPPPVPPPHLSGLSLSPKRFCVASSGARVAKRARARCRRPGTTIRYRDSERATATVRIFVARSGIRRGARCVAPPRRPRHAKRCIRFVKLGAFTHGDRAGANRFRFSGRLRGHPLTPGRYRLQVVATNAARRRSNVLSAVFTVVR